MKNEKPISETLIIISVTLLMRCGVVDSSKDIPEVIIGKQIWMSKNLNVNKFRTGEPIFHAITDQEWEEAANNNEPAWCYYKDSQEIGERYGRLYNSYAVSDPRGLAPAGWHVASDEEWTQLVDFLGGEMNAGNKLKSKEFWVKNEGENGGGTDESGFAGYPGGLRSPIGSYAYINTYGSWWTFSHVDTTHAWSRYVSYKSDEISRTSDLKGSGFSVRCIKND